MALPHAVLGAPSLSLSAEATETYLFEKSGQLFHAPLNQQGLPSSPPASPAALISRLQPATSIDQVGGGSYWLYLRLDNPTEYSHWALTSFNSIIDSLQAYVYTHDGVQQGFGGYLHPGGYNLHYGIDFQLPPGQQAEVLVFIQSRYFSGQPRLRISQQTAFSADVAMENIWILGCLGAIFILACYNLFIGQWMRDRSYLYYSAYLFLSVIGWAAGFGVWGEAFGQFSYVLLIPPFFLNISFNLLYFIHFLELPKFHVRLAYFCYGLAALAAVFTFTLPLFSPGLHLMILSLLSMLWVSAGLVAGILSWRRGYKPARFFVCAFALIFLGALVAIIPNFGFSPIFQNSYLATLIAQTFDILLLSLALADRINYYRSEKQLALEKLITFEKVKAEVEREAKQALADANEKLQDALELSEHESERKSDFLRMVSHELRTPLYSISASVDLWKAAVSEREQHDIFNDITYGATRLCNQVDNLVLMAETDDDRLQSENYPFELRPLLDKLYQGAEARINHNYVELDYCLSSDLPVNLKADAYLIGHLIRTVLDNACKYCDKGRIVFSVSWVEDARALNVTIKDDGCGMTQEQQEIVFQGFVQVSRGLTRKSDGLGLGLTLCCRLSNVLDASLSIASSLGKGTEISLQIPVLVLSDSEVVPLATAYNGPVLVVEDNIVNAKVLQRIVSKLGHPVDIEYSGLGALAAIEQRRYSVILMDVQMPDMDGITATRKMRGRGVTTPIVAVTANSDADVRRACRQAGMNDFLVKPVKPEEVERALLEWQVVLPVGEPLGDEAVNT